MVVYDDGDGGEPSVLGVPVHALDHHQAVVDSSLLQLALPTSVPLRVLNTQPGVATVIHLSTYTTF